MSTIRVGNDMPATPIEIIRALIPCVPIGGEATFDYGKIRISYDDWITILTAAESKLSQENHTT